MKATKENYMELLSEIADNYSLFGVTSVNQRNGYPSGIITLLEGLESEAQAQEILDKYEGAKLFELQWKDGWNTRYRLNCDVANRAYEADDLWKDDDISSVWNYGDKVKNLEIYYLGDAFESELKNLIEVLNASNIEVPELKVAIRECGLDEFRAVVEAAEEAEEAEELFDSSTMWTIEELRREIDWVEELREEFLALRSGEALVVDNSRSYRRVKATSMEWYDGDVTHRCIAIGFDPKDLPSEDEEE